MKVNILKINFKDISIFLRSKKIDFETNLSENDSFEGIKSLLNSNSNSLSFFSNIKYKKDLELTNTKACIIKKSDIHLLNNNIKYICVDDPYLVFALTTNFFYNNPQIKNIISDNAYIDQSCQLSNNIEISNNVTLKKNVSIGENSIIKENVFIGENVIIGKGANIYPNVVLTNTIIGDNCTIQSGSIIGDPGFGFTPKDKIPIIHIGNVLIGHNVTIGSSTTIDRASLDSTKIGNNVKIDNLVQVAHSVIIGDNSILASQVGIAGSTIIGKNCIIGGQAGVSGHLNIGDNVIIAAKSGVTKNIPHNKIVAGFPAIDIIKWKKNQIKINKI